jgi:serine protease
VEPTPATPVTYVAVVDDPGPSAPDIVTFTATSEQEKGAEVQKLQQQGTVVSVEPDAPVKALTVTPGDGNEGPGFAQQYGLKSGTPGGADFVNAWGTDDGTGVVIAIVDTGVLATHEDLGTTKVLPGADYVDGSTDGRSDPNGHGTHVAGIAAAADNLLGGLGGAPNATILPVRVLGTNGTGSTSAVAQGIDWAVDHGAKVVSLSLGACDPSSALQSAVQYANQHSVVVTAAAGNDNANAVIYPAAFDAEGVIAVAATDQNGNKSAFSDYGLSTDIAAPGTNIYSTYIGSSSSYAALSGTSMATPFVSAAAALLIQECPGIAPATVLQILQSHDAAVPGMSFGRLQAGLAVAATCVP